MAKKRIYEIWQSGFGFQELEGGDDSTYITREYGTSFRDACKNYAKDNPWFANHFDEEHLELDGFTLFEVKRIYHK